jgi:hypothetical protein
VTDEVTREAFRDWLDQRDGLGERLDPSDYEERCLLCRGTGARDGEMCPRCQGSGVEH